MSGLVYFSSSSENTLRFIERVGLPAVRIPLNERERIQVDEPYILVVPSYGGGGTAGGAPPPGGGGPRTDFFRARRMVDPRNRNQHEQADLLEDRGHR